MKKLFLFALSFAFGLALMAQNESKKAVDKKSTTQKTTQVKPVTTTTPATQTAQIQPTQPGPSPDDVMKVNTAEHNFGKIKQGVPVTYYFELKNISDKPLVVENTYASCGCTTPDKIVDPIMPGATAKLKVQFNAAAVGPINKDVHIKLAGIAQDKTVKITGEVLPPEPVQQPKSNN
ncbi:MAG: DUF1573 domain-containing protein [Chitinophagales bacterium]